MLAGSLERGWRGLLLEQSHLNKDGIRDKRMRANVTELTDYQCSIQYMLSWALK